MEKFCSLSKKHCTPCQGGVLPLKGGELSRLLEQLNSGWNVIQEHHLEKEYRFKDFVTALQFTNKVGQLAEEEGHHPDIHLSWGSVKIVLWTHKIEGLSESDFILASKYDIIYNNLDVF